MKKILKYSVLLLAVVLLLGFAGCDGGGGDTPCDCDDDCDIADCDCGCDTSGGGIDIDYTNYNTFSIRVKNDSGKNLVAFKGAPDASTLISGIPIGGGTHGLKRDTALFSTTSDFVLFLVTEEDYLEYNGNWTALESRPFTRLYAYYNTNAENNIVYNINSRLGGDRRIILQNSTAYNVELRNNGPQGEIIGFTLSQTYNTTFYVNAGDYMVFPVFRKFSTVLNEIVSAHPVYGPGVLEGRAQFMEFSLDNTTHQYNINASEFTEGFTLTAGAAFLKIVNNSGAGVGFWDGGVRQITESGGATINSNRDMLFPIHMTRTGEGNFQGSATKAQFRIGSSAAPIQVDSFEYFEGKIYEIQVTGANANSLEFSAITEIGQWSF